MKKPPKLWKYRATLDAPLASCRSPSGVLPYLLTLPPCITCQPLQLCRSLCLSHRPPLIANSLTGDWCFQVTSDLFPCLPNITGWPRPRNPARAREGAEVHTQKHTLAQTFVHWKTQPFPQLTQSGRTGAVLCSILSSMHLSSSSDYPWWCGCVRIHILLGMYLTEQ